MNFAHFSLDARITTGIKSAGYETPTPIQLEAIPHVLEGKDVLGLAQTGTGKTAAFLLPTLQKLSTGPTRRVRALILAPTRELAEQIRESAMTLGKFTKIKSCSIYGGVGKGGQIAALRRGAEIVVACPGRLLDLIGDKSIDLSHVETLILDEADRMCDMGFLPDIRRILKHLPKERQTLFFSATMPDDIRHLADEMLNDPVTVQIGLIAPAETVSHALYPIGQKMKKKLLISLLAQLNAGRILIFTRTKHGARNLARDLEKLNYNVIALQGNMSQNQRQKAINGFRDGKFDTLVATDIAARGIDISNITHVINFDMPDTVDAYTHRIGRTGRTEENGDAFTFATESDGQMIRQIERVLGQKIERRTLEGFDYEGFDMSSIDQIQSTNSGRSRRGGGGNKPRDNQRRGNNSRRRGGGSNSPTGRSQNRRPQGR